jgi:hypothetical protein
MVGNLLLIDIICLVLMIIAIKNSQQRLLSFGYAVLGFILVFALGLAASFVLMPARGNVIDVAADRRLTNSMALCRDLADQLWVTAIGYLSVIGQMANGQSKAGTGGQFVAGANIPQQQYVSENQHLLVEKKLANKIRRSPPDMVSR